MSPAVAVRPATDADLCAITDLERLCMGQHAWSRNLLGPALADAWVLEDLSGFAIVRVAGDVADLDRIAVHPAAQGRGVGRQLVAVIADVARTAGAGAVILEVADDNARALGLYQHCGFSQISRRHDYYGIGSHAIIMQLTL